MALFASVTFWLLLWFGRDDLGSRWRNGLIAVWVIGLFASAVVPGGGYLFMALISIIDIGLIVAVFGGDITIR